MHSRHVDLDGFSLFSRGKQTRSAKADKNRDSGAGGVSGESTSAAPASDSSDEDNAENKLELTRRGTDSASAPLIASVRD